MKLYRNQPGSPCNICGGQTRVLFVFDNPNHWVERCLDCQAECIKPFPTPEEIARTYTNYSTTKTPDEQLNILIAYATESLEFLLSRTNLNHTNVEKLAFLDVGFGNGAAVFSASLKGLRTYGIDLDPVNVENAKSYSRKIGISPVCTCGTIEILRSMQVQFNLVKVSQVLEHLANPTEFLFEIARNQPIGGYLTVDCPNNSAAFWLIKNRIRRSFGRMAFYNSLKLDEHLRGYTRRSLTLLLKKAGYQIRLCQDYPMGNHLFQPETALWYPRLSLALRRSAQSKRTYDLLKGLIRVFDNCASWTLGRGMGLFALAEKIN